MQTIQTEGPDSKQKPTSLPSETSTHVPRPATRRKKLLQEQADKLAVERDHWAARHPYYYEEEWRYLRFLVPAGKSILQLGCGNGHLLKALNPSHGVGVDFSAAKIVRAQTAHPELTFVCADVENLPDAPELARTFDVIIMSDTIGSLDDCLATLQTLQRFCSPGDAPDRFLLHAAVESLCCGFIPNSRPASASCTATGCPTRTLPTCCSSPTSTSSSRNGGC